MSNPNNNKNDNQDEKNRDSTKQADSHVTIHIHAAEDEEENVRGTVLREEKEQSGERNELEVVKNNGRTGVRRNKEHIVFFINSNHKASRFYGRPVQNAEVYSYQEGTVGPGMDYEDRGPFIRKTFGVLFFCVLATLLFAVTTFVVPGMREVFAGKIGLALGICGLVVYTAMSYALTCSDCARRSPCNCICLIILVLSMCLVFGWITSRYQVKAILVALGVTAVVVLLCIAISFSSLDFTKCYMIIIVAGMVLVMFALVSVVAMLVFDVYFKMLHLVLCCLLAMFQSVVFIMELQMILGGRTIEIGIDDWALGAYMLYSSLLSIFFDILQIIGILDCL